MKAADNSYYLVRRAQLRIVMRTYFRNGELYDIMNRSAFKQTAEKLTDKYFHRSGATVYDEVKELYQLYLALAPSMQKIKNSFKVDWTKGHAISWLRRLFNGRVRHWYYIHAEYERKHDPEQLLRSFRDHGITDKRFLDEAMEKYLCFWASEGLKGSLANCIFDPFIYRVKDTGIRIGNSVIETSKHKLDGYYNIFEKPIEIMGYHVVVYEKSGRTHINVTIRQSVIDDFKKRCEIIISTRTSPQYKLVQLASLVSQLLETAKYAKDSFYQIRGLQLWTDKKFRKLSGTEKKFKAIISMMTTRFIEKVVSKYTYQRTNFFWDKNHNDIPEKTFQIYFSPYREL
ncbi:hypothetical protein Dacet_0537 [Denitrovibrio acetiphilus DSM 12809]|uniref:Uncharacterized protein n=1 Tax=Denitrovibrio acetiphilus (strain DSM 12809 / NBRC 114555 / N2460) TaxID=522772 RepID=D4H424_DENA2|nr:hypothetical protein [Denitrovibrio acetiphilus]ADD67335.1 hypothetical protein Dacet_0537 [Denitrovibrio acetiphilus DSM 12809]